MIDPDTGEYLSEDYAFCRRWLALGGEIWPDRASWRTTGRMRFADGFQISLVELLIAQQLAIFDLENAVA
jgi:hypothetical protein